MNNTKRPLVSVVCAWFNRADFLRETVDSILAQDLKDLEFVIVNDGSTDDRVKDILSEYGDERLSVIHQENAGFVAAIRRAIDATTGTYIAVQGAGDISSAGRLKLQAKFLTENPEFGVVSCFYSNVVISRGSEIDRRLVKRKNLEPTEIDIRKSNPFSHGEVMYRRAMYDAVGGYRPFFKQSQDRDLWLRMAAHCKYRIIPTELYERRVFVDDGIAGDFGKALKQIAYSRVAEECFDARSRGEVDIVERYGDTAIIAVPSGSQTTNRINGAIRKFSGMRSLNYADLDDVRKIYGSLSYLRAMVYFTYRSITYPARDGFHKIKKLIVRRGL